MQITFIRHPQTEWNILNLLQGSKEGPISAQGQHDAIALVEGFREDFDILFSANNSRCLYLANLFFIRFDKQIIIDDRLNERSFGIYEGKNTSEIASEVGWKKLTPIERISRKPNGGESMQDVVNKMSSFLSDVLKNPSFTNKKLVCISSGGAIKAAMYGMKCISIENMFEIKIRNLQKLTFQSDRNGVWKLIKE